MGQSSAASYLGCLPLSSSSRLPFSWLNLQSLMVSALAINGEVKLQRKAGAAAILESTLAQEQQGAVLSAGGWKKSQESMSMIGMECSYPLHLEGKAGIAGTTATTVVTCAVAVKQQSHHEPTLAPPTDIELALFRMQENQKHKQKIMQQNQMQTSNRILTWPN